MKITYIYLQLEFINSDLVNEKNSRNSGRRADGPMVRKLERLTPKSDQATLYAFARRLVTSKRGLGQFRQADTNTSERNPKTVYVGRKLLTLNCKPSLFGLSPWHLWHDKRTHDFFVASSRADWAFSSPFWRFRSGHLIKKWVKLWKKNLKLNIFFFVFLDLWRINFLWYYFRRPQRAPHLSRKRRHKNPIRKLMILNERECFSIPWSGPTQSMLWDG